MIALASFENVPLRGGFLIVGVRVAREPMVDALGREAAAQTRINGKQLHIQLRAGMSERDLSVSLYHEILEAVTVASPHPPASVVDFNEGDFERAAQRAHVELGEATPARLNRLLQSFSFQEQ